MAAGIANEKMREEATCSICQQLMTEPTSIDCGHSFCNPCILGLIQKKPLLLNQQRGACPLCQTLFRRTSIRPNKQLKSLIAVIKEMEHKQLCEEHGEQLHLFCEDDGQLICWYCERSLQHKGHTTLLITDAWEGYKPKLQEAVEKLEELKVKYENLKKSTKEHLIDCVWKIESQKQNVQCDFKDFKNFLDELEQSYISRLDEEREKVLRRLKGSAIGLEKQSRKLKKHTLKLEKILQGSAETSLQAVKDSLNTSSSFIRKLSEDVDLNHDTPCNVSELNFDVKTIAKNYQERLDLSTRKEHDAGSAGHLESKTDSCKFGRIAGPPLEDLASSHSGDFKLDSNDKKSPGDQ